MVKNTMFNKKSITNNYSYLQLILIVLIPLIMLGFLLYYLKKKTVENFEQEEYFSGGMNRVEKILYINLDNRKDRLEAIEKQLKEQGAQMSKVKKITAHYTPGNGHFGCAKSHLDAIKYASKMGFENVLILEDDFKFSTKKEETHNLFNSFFDQVNNNEWDVIMMAHLHGKTTDSKYPFLKKIIDAQTSSGYVVNKSYYPIMISIFEKCINNMPQEKTSGVNFEQWALDQVWKENQKKDKWFVFDPLIGKQDGQLVSTIQSITNYNT